MEESMYMIFKQLHLVNGFEPSKTLHHPKEGNIAFILVLVVIEKKEKRKISNNNAFLEEFSKCPQQPKLKQMGFVFKYSQNRVLFNESLDTQMAGKCLKGSKQLISFFTSFAFKKVLQITEFY